MREDRKIPSFSSAFLGLIWGRSQSSLNPYKARERGLLVHPFNPEQCVQSPLLVTPYSIFPKGYEKLDTLPKTARYASDSSSDSNGTMRRMRERTGMHQPSMEETGCVSSVTKEEAGLDLDSEGQAE